MKHFISFCLLSIAFFITGSIHSCRKENIVPPPVLTPNPVVTTPITTSYTEEFDDFYSMQGKGWYMSEYSQMDTIATTAWSPGFYGGTKYDTTFYGFYAFSYQYGPGDYAYSYAPAAHSNFSFSSWLFSPILVVKNGNSIPFIRAEIRRVFIQIVCRSSWTLWGQSTSGMS
jgi:hypothetical protein